MTYHEILKRYWGYDSFRDIQQDIIESIGAGQDTLGLMPTGGGKSITFQVPALAKPGMCIVITPLIALMKDQVQNLRKRNIKALAIYSGMTHEEILVQLENCIFGDYKFLYISPERLSTNEFRNWLRKMNINMIAVDESHCISQWGYDFRPSYLKIAEIREMLPDIPVLALTATATPEVAKDIQAKLHFKKENVFRMSFERKNLAYIVRKTENKAKELLHILTKTSGSAIIYARNRKSTKEITELLQKNGITAQFYHAGLTNEERNLKQQQWKENVYRVIVATNAFGMGIDKPDVRLVVHVDLPDSIEAYFQEAGRAGRDRLKAYSVVLYANTDKAMLAKRISDTFPEKKYIKDVYESLNYYYQMAMGDGQGCTYDFSLEEFCRRFKYFPVQADSALKILAQAGYIEYTDEQDNASRLIFTLRRDELYKLRDNDNNTDKTIQHILRNYTGVFTDYVYINEDNIALQTGLNRQEIYQTLLSLSQRRIIHYIPRKKTPRITYICGRVEPHRLYIPPSAYEERKKRYTARIKAILNYANSTEHCRSRMLLQYFGEYNDHNCQQCDICLSRHESGLKQGEFNEIRENIERMLQNGAIPPETFQEKLQYNPQKLQTVLHFLILEEELETKDGMVALKGQSISKPANQTKCLPTQRKAHKGI